MIAVSRALGDAHLKTSKPALIADPEFIEFQPCQGDILVLGCDGLYDVLSSEHVMQLVNQYNNEKVEQIAKEVDSGPEKSLIDQDGNDTRCSLVSRILVDHAFANDTKDNVSVVLVKLDSPGKILHHSQNY